MASISKSLIHVEQRDVVDKRELLISVIQRVLRKKTIGFSDRFLDCSHDLRKTILVIREIKRRTGIELPLSLFVDTTSIEEIAAALTTSAWPPAQPFTILKEGEDAPLFLLCGLGGAIMELIPLVARLSFKGPIYAIPFPGFDGYSKPHLAVEPAAAEFLALIRKLHPGGPYKILAYSAGGQAALAMTALLAPTEDISFLGMIETGQQDSQWPLSVWLKHICSLMLKHGINRSEPPVAAVAPASAKRYDRWRAGMSKFLGRVRLRYRNPLGQDFAALSPYYVGNLPENVQAVRDACLVSLARYRPHRYSGRVYYFLSEEGDPLMVNPRDIWKRYLPKAEYLTINGNHATLLGPPHVDTLASHISRLLS